MAISNFIPQVWAAKLLIELRKALVYGGSGIINKNFQGDISKLGDSVKVSSIGDISIFDYAKNTDISALQTLDDSAVTLIINQAKAFNFQIDDVDNAQMNPKIMMDAMQKAAYKLADAADQYIASNYIDIANTIGSDATPEVLTAANAYDKLVDMRVALDEANVPTIGRWAVVPPWVYGLLLKDDRFVGTGGTQAENVLTNGVVGKAAGFTIYESNNVPNTTGAQYKIIGGTSSAWSFAEQINSVEAYRPEKRFADAVKGLHLYGSKVMQPAGLVVLTANKDSGTTEED
ncbi:MAG: P22 coat protein - protein 5 domain protein [Oscillospiraceae bacterium]|jgi:hypothetical protein|nr:P22 coat protein - protein 5 domain protein [Oscillospiraceae bacterium]